MKKGVPTSLRATDRIVLFFTQSTSTHTHSCISYFLFASKDFLFGVFELISVFFSPKVSELNKPQSIYAKLDNDFNSLTRREEQRRGDRWLSSLKMSCFSSRGKQKVTAGQMDTAAISLLYVLSQDHWLLCCPLYCFLTLFQWLNII